MLVVSLLVKFAFAYTIKGILDEFGAQDIQSTRIHLEKPGFLAVEPLSSAGHFTFRNIDEGEYTMHVKSSTLEDDAFYSLTVEDGALSARRVLKATMIDYPIDYPLRLISKRRVPPPEPRKPRLHHIYTDKMVIMGLLGLAMFTFLPKIILSLDPEELQALNGQDEKSSFAIASKLAAAHSTDTQ